MNPEQLRNVCLALPHATEDVKWESDLCFCVGGKMFCVTGLDQIDGQVSFKCAPEKFAELIEIDGVIPAPYLARYHWVAVQKPDAIDNAELEELISGSYWIVRQKLPKKIRDVLA